MEPSERTRHRRPRAASPLPTPSPFDPPEPLEGLDAFDDWDDAAGDHPEAWREIEHSIGRLDRRGAAGSRRRLAPVRNLPPPAATEAATEATRAARYAAMLGLATFLPGVALLVWSFASARTDLWSQGITLAIVGQGFLSIGVLLSLPRLWRRQQASDSEADS